MKYNVRSNPRKGGKIGDSSAVFGVLLLLGPREGRGFKKTVLLPKSNAKYLT